MTINPKDIPSANVTIVGYAGGPAEERTFPNGGTITELNIGVSTGYKKGDEWVDTGTNWYTLTASSEYAADNWPDVQKGDKVRVDDGRLEFHAYTGKSGAQTDATVRFGTLVVLESKDSRPARGDSDRPF